MATGSTAARRGFAGGASYCASKFGLAGLSEAMLHDVRGHDVRVLPTSLELWQTNP